MAIQAGGSVSPLYGRLDRCAIQHRMNLV